MRKEETINLHTLTVSYTFLSALCVQVKTKKYSVNIYILHVCSKRPKEMKEGKSENKVQ